MDKAVKLLDEHLKAVCEALADWKTSDTEKYSEQIGRFEEMKLSYTNAIKILTTKADTGEKQCNLPVVNPSNLTIRVLNIDIQDFSLDKQLAERNISPDTIISCQNIEDDIMLIYYWG